MNLKIPQSNGLTGKRQVPGDKSISHRALMIGSIADGTSEIHSCSQAVDPRSTLSCIKQLGIQVVENSESIIIYGKGRNGFRESPNPLDAGNSGTTMRLFSGILSGQHFHTTIIGDSSLSKRPMKRILDPLHEMGANIYGTKLNTAPISIKPVDKLRAINYYLPVPSAQVKSAILFAGLFAEGQTKVTEKSKSRDHTERMLGLNSMDVEGKYIVDVSRDVIIEGKKLFVPGDISSAAFIIAAGILVPGSNLKIINVGLNPTRTRILDIFKLMGGNIQIDNERIIEGEQIGDIIVSHSELHTNLDLRGSMIVDLIDEIPILSITALFADGIFSLHDAKELRTKETDRIAALVKNIRLLGLDVEEYEDGFSFESKKSYTGNKLDSYQDHRIAMSFGVAGLRIPNIEILNADCVDISFPNFWKELFIGT